MSKQIVQRLLFGFTALLAFSSCAGPANHLPIATPSAAVPTVAAPTATATPTNTPRPTHTPTLEPSPTVTVTFTPTAPPATATPQPEAGWRPYFTRVEYSFSGSGTQAQTVRYLMYFPAAYGKDPARRWPLLLFLHGSGEAGEDLNLLKRIGLPEMLTGRTDFPFVVVAPQLSAPSTSSRESYMMDARTYLAAYGWSKMIEPLNALMDRIEAAYAIDQTRVYLTGLSLGGYGAWEYAFRYPRRFAAVVPIAGGYEPGSDLIPANVCELKDTPVWVFHGAVDRNVPARQSEVLVDALKECGAKIKFTLYPDGGHNDSWNRAYRDPALWQWLLSQTKPKE